MQSRGRRGRRLRQLQIVKPSGRQVVRSSGRQVVRDVNVELTFIGNISPSEVKLAVKGVHIIETSTAAENDNGTGRPPCPRRPRP